MSEQLLKDNERGTIIGLVEASDAFIQKVRDTRNRQAIFEHIEWVYGRWKEHPPIWWQRAIEVIIDRPLRHDFHRWIWLGVAGSVLLALVIVWLHAPNLLPAT